MDGRPLAGRKPLGNKPMTVAERQVRFRAAHADGAPKVRQPSTGAQPPYRDHYQHRDWSSEGRVNYDLSAYSCV